MAGHVLVVYFINCLIHLSYRIYVYRVLMNGVDYNQRLLNYNQICHLRIKIDVLIDFIIIIVALLLCSYFNFILFFLYYFIKLVFL